jgi:hypothetical protein
MLCTTLLYYRLVNECVSRTFSWLYCSFLTVFVGWLQTTSPLLRTLQPAPRDSMVWLLFVGYNNKEMLVKVSAAVGAVLGLADVAMHSCICSVTGVCTLADKATHSYICSVTSVCIYGVYKHVAPTFLDQSSTIWPPLLFNKRSRGYIDSPFRQVMR